MPIMWLSSHDLTRQRRRPNKSASSRIFFFILFFSVILVHQCGDRNVARDMSLKAERIDCGRKFRQTSTLSVSFRGYLRPRDFANPAFVRTIYFKLAIVAAGLSDTSTSFDEEIIVDWKEEEKRWSREWGAPCFRRSQSITKDSIQFFESVNYREHTIHEYQGMIHESGDSHVEHGERTFTPCGRNCFRCIVPL